MQRRPTHEPTIKAFIMGLSEKEVLNIVEGYAEHVSTRVFRTCKQIANRCYQAVIAIRAKKAMGYGRSPQQATNNCMRKMAEAIYEEQHGKQFIQQSFEKGKQSGKCETIVVSGGENTEKCLKVQKVDRADKIQCLAQSQQPSRSASKENFMKVTIHENKIKEGQTQKHILISRSNHQSRSVSKIQKLKALIESPKVSDDGKTMSIKFPQDDDDRNDQLKKALAYIEKLETQLKSFADQNKMLRELLIQRSERRKTRITTENTRPILEAGVVPACHMNRQSSLSAKFKSVNNHVQDSISFDLSKNRSFAGDEEPAVHDDSLSQHEKKKIPRLNLRLLPNYHGNSNKSLNHSMLLAYEKKKAK